MATVSHGIKSRYDQYIDTFLQSGEDAMEIVLGDDTPWIQQDSGALRTRIVWRGLKDKIIVRFQKGHVYMAKDQQTMDALIGDHKRPGIKKSKGIYNDFFVRFLRSGERMAIVNTGTKQLDNVWHAMKYCALTNGYPCSVLRDDFHQILFVCRIDMRRDSNVYVDLFEK